ncbi:hypothetical protein ABZ215_33345 [Amycolatopsis sp. NPDC006131]|uniref:hypothetical protein n=1 Tax=Amycolatopsis sp. NPDC006131 TaxID=3156731 RepID=UPI00339DE533
MSTQELLELYPDAEQRSRVLRLHSLSYFLTHCVIDDKYRVPEGLHTPIVLTSYGEKIFQRLSKAGVPFPEARLLCFLEMLGPKPLVDVERTNIDKVISAISQQIKSHELLLTFRFGRQLFDHFNGLHDQEKSALSNKETLELLHSMPQGVYQVDEFVSGPYGLLLSSTSRLISPRTTIPLQFCSDSSCRLVHKIALTTSQDAPINEHRSKIGKMLDSDGQSIEAWFRFFDTFGSKASHSSESNGEPYITLIGDALTDEEMRSCLAWLLDKRGGQLRSVAETVGLRGKSETITSKLNRAQMLQLICTADNESIVAALDALVAEQQIKVPEGEVRTATVNRDTSYGPYSLFAELSRLGVRLQSRRTSIAPLRLRQLVDKMYNLQEQSDRDELLWQLRAEPEESVERRLQRHLQNEDPSEIIERLALARRSNVIVASEYLKFDERIPRSDAMLVDTMMWKLGFPVDTFPDKNARLFSLQEEILLEIRRKDSEASTEFYENLDSLCHKFWKELEDVLYDSASYVTWALTTDHFTSQKPFTYREDVDPLTSLLSLNDDEDNSEHKVEFSDKPNLYALCRAFQRLAGKLSGIQVDKSKYKRDDSQYPEWSKVEELQVFPFDHTIPFLDLADDSQASIIELLKSVSKLLLGAQVSELRNATNHPRRSPTSLEQLRVSLENTREAISLLESNGLCRLTYSLASHEGDAMERQKMMLSHRRGYQHVIYLPNSYSWLHFPRPTEPQYVMGSARIKESAEVLRFTRSVDSPFAHMYSDYPIRPTGLARERNADSKDESEAR